MIVGTVQISKGAVTVSLLHSGFIYMCSRFCVIVAVLSQIYTGAKSLFCPPEEIN